MAEEPRKPTSMPTPKGGDRTEEATPGDGTLDGAVPAGLTADQLAEVANRKNTPSDSGTG